MLTLMDAQTTIGKYRHLGQCADTRGAFAVLAIDHRGNLLSEMEKYSEYPVTYRQMVDFKALILRYLLPEASAALIDPDYGLPALLNAPAAGHVGLLAPLEVTDYARRTTQLIPGWDVAKLKKSGFSGAKLLLYFHPDAPDAADKTAMVDAAVEQCERHALPLFLEPIATTPDGGKVSGLERTQVILETARHFSLRGIDVLKLEYPLEPTATRAEAKRVLTDLNAACAVPWTLLSAGVPFETFLAQTAVACGAGASGVIAGRAIWGEAVALHGEERRRFLATVGRERMARLAATCRGLAQPWSNRYAFPLVGEGWYR